jgi:hypothetical protein
MVPMKAEAYRTGYSLEMLRDLEQVPLNTPRRRTAILSITASTLCWIG